MLVTGAWNDPSDQFRILVPDLPDDSPLSQSEPRAEPDLPTGLLPEPAPAPAVAAPSNRKLAQGAPASNLAREPNRKPSPRLEVWYAAAPRQETETPAHGSPPHQPAIWVPAANQDGGG
jgi:hypothetical protein